MVLAESVELLPRVDWSMERAVTATVATFVRFVARGLAVVGDSVVVALMLMV